jgi:hypothetical protein
MTANEPSRQTRQSNARPNPTAREGWAIGKVRRGGSSATTPHRRRSGPVAFLFLTFIVAAAASVAPAAALAAACGMLPTLVVVMLDWSDNHSVSCAVGGMNLAGVFPFLPALWIGGGETYAGAGLLANTTVLVVMYAAAAAGWVLIALMPELFVWLQGTATEHRVSQLKATQRKLVAEWGTEIDRGDAHRPAAPGR